MNRTISVIIPTYYRNEVLSDAIESVLGQNYRPIELIVVDDSGEGHAEPVLDGYDDLIAVYRDENGGQEAALETGIARSTGAYVQFLDDDDILLSGKLRQTVRVLESDSDVGVAYCGLVTDSGRYHYPKPNVRGDVMAEALRLDAFPCMTMTMLIERELLHDVLPLTHVDLGVIIELAEKTEFDYVDRCLACYRKEESRRWTGAKKYQIMRMVVREHDQYYRKYPDIRRELLGTIYEEEGRERLRRQWWSAAAIASFLRATYYNRENRTRCFVECLASLFGRPGYIAARYVRNRIYGKPEIS